MMNKSTPPAFYLVLQSAAIGRNDNLNRNIAPTSSFVIVSNYLQIVFAVV